MDERYQRERFHWFVGSAGNPERLAMENNKLSFCKWDLWFKKNYPECIEARKHDSQWHEKPIRTNPETTQITDLVDKGTGRVITTVFHTFWKLEERLVTPRRDGEYLKGGRTSGGENSRVQMKHTPCGDNAGEISELNWRHRNGSYPKLNTDRKEWGSCGTKSMNIMNVQLESEKEKRRGGRRKRSEETMIPELPNLMKTKSMYLRSSTNSEHKKHEENNERA